ncbi:hypothetical protein GCM10009850_006730 [Nonomuraea monospora]|uniref:Uncharacterized protein n=1 Tax=Nonomuraea monospora TaxID=568818 RepID=A0ABN3C6T2_9ACTN
MHCAAAHRQARCRSWPAPAPCFEVEALNAAAAAIEQVTVPSIIMDPSTGGVLAQTASVISAAS